MRSLLDVIFPPLCPVCECVVSKKSTFCGDCWPKLNFISDPFCTQCSLPFESSILEENSAFYKCASCLQTPPAFSLSRSVYVYDDVCRKMILSFKHGQSLHLGPVLADGMWHAGKFLLESADVMLPVPLHWKRLYKRGFNQSAVLARHISALSKKPVALNLLKRTQNTPSQGILSLEDRAKNVKNCFKVSDSHQIKNRIVVLIDDVMTTGATLNASAHALLRAGAKEVRTLCIARVKP